MIPALCHHHSSFSPDGVCHAHELERGDITNNRPSDDA
jgi:hypothetical protein